MARRKTKRSNRKDTKIGAENKYKAFNAFLMLVILFFVLFFIARMPKHERASMVRPSAVNQIAKAPKPPAPITPPAISPVGQSPVAPKPAEPPKKPITVSAPKPPAPQKALTAVVKTPAPAPKPIAATAKKSVNFAKTKALPLKTAAAAAPPAPRPAAPSIPKPPPVMIKPPEKALPPAAAIPAAPIQSKGKIAIVLDDWGYRAGSPGTLNARLYPITAAVIPNLKHTRSAIKQLHENGYEIILHLPMEPTDKINLEPDTITTDMNESQIRKIVDQDLSEISYAKGINNHMGSRATSDMRTMVPVFKELRRNRLYFLDSYTSNDSVCEDLAQKLKVSFAKRDVFIDNEPDPEYIRGPIAKLKSLASLRGWAIGIGHDRKSTLEVLQEELPKIRNEGYELIYVSELAK